MDILGLIGIGISLLVTGFNAAIWMIVKFNDLRHLETSVKELVETLKDTNKKLEGTAERIAKIEGKCTANHGS